MRDLSGPTLDAFPISGRRWTFRHHAGAISRRARRGRTLRPPKVNRVTEETSGRKGRTRFVTWAASFLLHAAVLFAGVSLLFHPVRFDVAGGKTSTELVLVAPPPEAVTPVPPKPAAPVTVPPPQAQPVLPPAPLPVVVKVAVTIPPQPVAVSTPARDHAAAKPVVKMAVRTAREATPAARGAVQARPDDIANQPPVYPEDSRAAREQGIVMLRVEVTPMGSASRVAILQSSGYFRLDQAARRAVQEWRFHPASIGSEAIPSEVEVPVRFVLQ